MRFVDVRPRAGLGVLLDWVPAHFPQDQHGLIRFDGRPLYEHADPRRGQHREWGTAVYDYGRREVAAFLASNALYWLRDFHADGLRVDAVSAMIWLDHGRAPGDWAPNEDGSTENREAMAFLRQVNTLVEQDAPGASMMAEEATSFPGVTRPVAEGGLGFRYKWNMGWMNDTLRYIKLDPVHRRWHHQLMNFGLMYAFTEDFVLPLSHDEVVHGKGTLLGRIPGDEWQRFATMRAYFAFMWGYPGKKLLFMGGEWGQYREWSEEREPDWSLLQHPNHQGLQRCVRDLNGLYRNLPGLHARDCEPEGLPLDRRGRCGAVHPVLDPLRRAARPAGRGRLQLHARAAPQPAHRPAARGSVAGGAEHRRARLWRLRHGQPGRGDRGRGAGLRPAGLRHNGPAASCDRLPRARGATRAGESPPCPLAAATSPPRWPGPPWPSCWPAGAGRA
jgi:alpha-1,4-glucan:alpha-1,4-glucan 6-glycosyltransferase